jgi:hypothetical protein
MSLMLLLAAPALASRVYWTGPPTDLDTSAVARTVPDATFAPIDAMMGGPGMTAGTDPAIVALRKEVDATKPLFDIFDGELQIMGRLDTAIADVRLVRSVDERNLVWNAMLLEGYAVQRYFQEKVATDPAAAPYRTGGAITPWMDASALVGAPTPTSTELPDAASRVAFDSVQAGTRSMPSLTFVVGDLARGAEVYVDGQKVEGGAGARVLAVPGRHFAHVEAGGLVLLARAERFAAGSMVTLSAPFGPAERDELLTLARNAAPGWTVPAATAAMVQAAAEPVYLAVPGDGRPRLLRLDGGTASNVRIQSDASDGNGPVARIAVGAGWASTGDWFLQNLATTTDGVTGAPYTTGTVNAVAPAVAVGAGWRAGWFYAGAGVDVQVPLGDWHSLPSGDGSVRPFVYPHVAVGVPYAQLTIGPEFPWYLGLGAQAELPVAGAFEIFGRGVYGVGLTQQRGAGEPDFDPTSAWSAWLGVAWRFGG